MNKLITVYRDNARGKLVIEWTKNFDKLPADERRRMLDRMIKALEESKANETDRRDLAAG